MFENYWLGAGDQQLSADRFRSISGAAAALNPLETLQLGPDLIRKQFGFYNNREYDYGLGTAFLFYNRRGNAVGFYDYYNASGRGDDPKSGNL